MYFIFVKKSPIEIDYLYDKFNIPRNKKILLYVGNLLPHKNLNKLLEGFAQMQGRENCRLVLVGKAFDGRSKETCEKELGIEEFTIHAGMVSQEDLVNFCVALPRYKRPKKFIFAEVPRNPTGKIEKPKLRERYCGKSLVATQIELQ